MRFENTVLHSLIDFDRYSLFIAQTCVPAYQEEVAAAAEDVADIPGRSSMLSAALHGVRYQIGLFRRRSIEQLSTDKGILALIRRTLEFGGRRSISSTGNNEKSET